MSFDLTVTCGDVKGEDIPRALRNVLAEVLGAYKQKAHELITLHVPLHTGKRSKGSLRYGTIRDRLHESVERSTIFSYVLNGKRAYYIKFVDKMPQHHDFFTSKLVRPLRSFVNEMFRSLMRQKGLEVA